MKATDLNKYRDALMFMRARLLRTVDDLEKSIVDDVHTQGESNVPTHLADAATEGLDENIALAKNEEGLVEQIDEALLSVENGTYGKCASCGKEIRCSARSAPLMLLAVLPAKAAKSAAMTVCCGRYWATRRNPGKRPLERQVTGGRGQLEFNRRRKA